jgi:hypothetical protein
VVAVAAVVVVAASVATGTGVTTSTDRHGACSSQARGTHRAGQVLR